MLHLLKQKKGYVLLETLVVVGILTIVLVGMYSSFINMYSKFREQRNYDNTEYLYKTKVLREQLNLTPEFNGEKIITICNNLDENKICKNDLEYGSVFEELDVQYAFFAHKNITTGDVYNLSNIPVTIKRYIRDLDTKASDEDVILIVAYKSENPGFEIASINYSKTDTDTRSYFEKLTSGLDSGTTDVITKPSSSNWCTNTLAFDGTVDNNLRYVGSRPCNYVTFNNEKWRIIGVMNHVDDGTGKKETRLKIIRSLDLSPYSWDSSDSSINGGKGVNDWTKADLMQELNGDYLDTTLTEDTYWYDSINNSKRKIYRYSDGLKELAQKYIGDAKWYLGGTSLDQLYNIEGEGTAAKFYGYERGTNVWGSTSGQVCEDGACPRATEWTGKVALMYPSDFGFAVGEDVRSICLEKKLSEYGSDSCYTSQWLPTYAWTLSPRSSESTYVIRNVRERGLRSEVPYVYSPVYPVVYLKSWIRITGGEGTPEKPYTLGI